MNMTPVQQAAREEYEYYGSTLTLNTFLKAALMVCVCVIALLAVELGRTAKAAANVKPLVVRISEVGRAEAVSLGSMTYTPQAPEIRYFLTQFVTGFYGRNHGNVREKYVNSLYFLDRALFDRIDSADRRSQWLPKFVTSTDDDLEISIRTVVIENLQTEPYRARVEFTKTFVTTSGTETKRENWTAVFDFRIHPESVSNEFVQHNPLGLAITYFRQDQAFTN